MALLGVGLVQVYSSSFVFATESYGDGLYFFKRQLLFTFIAFGSLLVSAQIPIKWVEKWGWLAWVAAGLGVFATFVPGLGVRVGGAIRWLQLPWGLRFEPSEFLKLSFSLLFASVLVRKENYLGELKWGYLGILMAVPLMALGEKTDFVFVVLPLTDTPRSQFSDMLKVVSY